MKKHKIELRDRPIKESFCIQPGCRFRGKHAQQGVCFSEVREAQRDNMFLAEIRALSARMGKERDEIRKSHYKKNDKGWIRWLEAMYESAMLNWHLGLNETVQLRAENAILKDKLEKRSRRAVSAAIASIDTMVTGDVQPSGASAGRRLR